MCTNNHYRYLHNILFFIFPINFVKYFYTQCSLKRFNYIFLRLKYIVLYNLTIRTWKKSRMDMKRNITRGDMVVFYCYNVFKRRFKYYWSVARSFRRVYIPGHGARTSSNLTTKNVITRNIIRTHPTPVAIIIMIMIISGNINFYSHDLAHERTVAYQWHVHYQFTFYVKECSSFRLTVVTLLLRVQRFLFFFLRRYYFETRIFFYTNFSFHNHTSFYQYRGLQKFNSKGCYNCSYTHSLLYTFWSV